MADGKKSGGKKAKKSDSKAPDSPDKEPETVASRVSNLPLVSSACEAVSSAYNATKESVPLLKGVMGAAESGVRTLGAAASTGAQPLLNMMEPQLAAANECALRGLDKVEEKMPVLHQPADKVVSDTVEKVCLTVAGATGAVVEAVKDGVEKTRGAVNSGINTVMGTKADEKASTKLDLKKRRADDWVTPALPVTRTALAAVADTETPGIVASPGTYFVCLSKLDGDLRKRALEISLARAKHYVERAKTTAGQISKIIDLLVKLKGTQETERVAALTTLQDHWKDWEMLRGTNGTLPEPIGDYENVESKSLCIACQLSDELRTECSSIVSTDKGLPGRVKENLVTVQSTAEGLYVHLENTNSVTKEQVKEACTKLTTVENSGTNLIAFLMDSDPHSWVVGPFRAQFPEDAGDVSLPGPSMRS